MTPGLHLQAFHNHREDHNQSGSSREKKMEKSKTPVLDNFGRDLTQLAEDGKLDPIIGREKEIERVAQVLSRRKKNNPVLIGEPGLVKLPLPKALPPGLLSESFTCTIRQARNCTRPRSPGCRHQIPRPV
jgi:ATP-dependent Clp protease ATP-binding subunit ClpC